MHQVRSRKPSHYSPAKACWRGPATRERVANHSRRQGCRFDKCPEGLQHGSAGRHVPSHVWLWPHNLRFRQGLITSMGGKWITVILQGTAPHSPLIGMPNPSQCNESGTIQIIIRLSTWLHSPLSMELSWCGIQNVMKGSTSLEKLTCSNRGAGPRRPRHMGKK